MVAAVKKHAAFLSLIFFVGLFVRAAVFYGYLSQDANYWQVDSAGYHTIASGIAAGKGIASPAGIPNFYRVPGYPLYLAVWYKVFGNNPIPALWGQLVLGALIPLLIFFLALALFPARPRLAMAASAYSAVHLGLVLYSGFMMTETLFIIFLLGFLILFFQAGDNPRGLASAGALLGIASLIRPIGHYLMPICLVILLLRKFAWSIKVRNALLLFIAWLIPVSMWLARNYLLLGHIFFHTLPGGHFLHLSASRVVMHAEDMTYQQARMRVASEARRAIRNAQRTQHRGLSEIECCYELEKLAHQHFVQHPWITLKLWATDMFRTAFSLYSAELLFLDSGRKEMDYFAKDRGLWDMISRYIMPPTDSMPLRAIIMLEIVLYLLLLLGLCRALWGLFANGFGKDLAIWLTAGAFIAFFIVIALAGGYARMRLPVEPLIIILGLSGYVVEKRSRARAKK